MRFSVFNLLDSSFLSTLSLRRATKASQIAYRLYNISIHALLAESDFEFYNSLCQRTRFLSTLSLRRATQEHIRVVKPSHNFYPRSPCGERRDVIAEMTDAQSISIHALLAESDAITQQEGINMCIFLSTLSLRRATLTFEIRITTIDNFYPRSPCGERQLISMLNSPHRKFLSTLSLRRATLSCSVKTMSALFLSTLSLRRATAKVHKTVGHFCAYETNFMGIASSC